MSRFDLSAPVAGLICIALAVAFAFAVGPLSDLFTWIFERRPHRSKQGVPGAVHRQEPPAAPLPRGNESEDP